MLDDFEELDAPGTAGARSLTPIDREPDVALAADELGVRVARASAPVPEAAQETRFTANGFSLDQILADRPDVYQAYFTQFYGAANDRNSEAWIGRVGGDTPQDYANYWYETYGRFEGYAPAGAEAEFEPLDIARLLRERPDVFQAYFTEYYGPHNDQRSSAWLNRVGGESVEDYARYWYVHYGRAEGYSQASSQAAGPGPVSEDGAPSPPSAPDPGYRQEDPSLDPWNHPALYPGATPPDPTEVGQGFPPPDPFG